MALSIKTEEADRLARQLGSLTDETMTQAVTRALAERLERVQDQQADRHGMADRLMAFARSIASHYDRRPLSRAEQDAASADLWDEIRCRCSLSAMISTRPISSVP